MVKHIFDGNDNSNVFIDGERVSRSAAQEEKKRMRYQRVWNAGNQRLFFIILHHLQSIWVADDNSDPDTAGGGGRWSVYRAKR